MPLFGVLCVVARMTQADQVRVHPSKLWILVGVLYMVHLHRLTDPPVPLADLAAVAVAPKDLLALATPGFCVVIK